MLKVGLLGAGRIAGVHATAIATNPGSTLVAVSDINAEAGTKLAAQYGAEARTTDTILNDPAIDAILIATSTDTHSDLIERATAAGKAVLSRKAFSDCTFRVERALSEPSYLLRNCSEPVYGVGIASQPSLLSPVLTFSIGAK